MRAKTFVTLLSHLYFPSNAIAGSAGHLRTEIGRENAFAIERNRAAGVLSGLKVGERPDVRAHYERFARYHVEVVTQKLHLILLSSHLSC